MAALVERPPVGSDSGAWFWSVRRHGGAGGDDSACDVEAYDCGVTLDGWEAVVALVVVDWIECDGFDFDEEVVRTWGRSWAVGNFEDSCCF